ncbi:hypothetical protein D3C71_1664640 [compost metagenome]
MSSAVSSSAAFAPRLKKLVGGICRGSPAITTCLPRAIEPMASQGAICEASSKITRSNGGWSAGRNCAIDSGLMSMHGARRLSDSPISMANWRTGLCRRDFCSSCLRIAKPLCLATSFFDGISPHSLARM